MKSSSQEDINAVRIDGLEHSLIEIKDKLNLIDKKIHEVEANILVKEKISEAWLRNIAIVGGLLTTFGALGTVYYFLINNIDSHLSHLIH